LILLNSERIPYEIEQSITSPLYDLELDIGEVISPMIYSEKEWNSKYRFIPFSKNVMREGKLLRQNTSLKTIALRGLLTLSLNSYSL